MIFSALLIYIRNTTAERVVGANERGQFKRMSNPNAALSVAHLHFICQVAFQSPPILSFAVITSFSYPTAQRIIGMRMCECFILRDTALKLLNSRSLEKSKVKASRAMR